MNILFKVLPTLSIFLFNAYISVAQKAEIINIKGETYYGVRSIHGYTVTGLYKYEGKGEPIVQLNPDGSGLFQSHGVPANKIRWWIMADQDGNVKTIKGKEGQSHTLITQNTEDLYQTISGGRKVLAYPAGGFDMKMLTVRYEENKIFILGEREKSAN